MTTHTVAHTPTGHSVRSGDVVRRIADGTPMTVRLRHHNMLIVTRRHPSRAGCNVRLPGYTTLHRLPAQALGLV